MQSYVALMPSVRNYIVKIWKNERKDFALFSLLTGCVFSPLVRGSFWVFCDSCASCEVWIFHYVLQSRHIVTAAATWNPRQLNIWLLFSFFFLFVVTAIRHKQSLMSRDIIQLLISNIDFNQYQYMQSLLAIFMMVSLWLFCMMSSAATVTTLLKHT